MRKIAVFASVAALLVCVVIFGMACMDNPGNPEPAPTDSSGTTIPVPGGTGQPDTLGIVITPDTSGIILPDTSGIVITPDTSGIIIPPDTSDIVIPPDTSDIVIPPDTSDIVIPPDTSGIVIPPDTSDIIIPPDSSDIIIPPDTSDIIIPPDTSVITPPLSPKDSILNHIDKNWKSYGYASKPTKYVALTFDDGPCAQTGSLLAALESKKVKATFFLIGQNVRNNQNQAKAVHDAGHELANHSDGYSSLGGNTAMNTISESLTAASAAITNVTGKNVSLFRAPSVDYGSNLTAACTQQGLAIIGVSIWSQDYQSGISSSATANNVINNAADGGIINCHEPNTAPNTIAAIPTMIDGLRAKGFWICTVSELAIIKGKILQAGTQYDSITLAR